jgi:hypothetical protein
VKPGGRPGSPRRRGAHAGFAGRFRQGGGGERSVGACGRGASLASLPLGGQGSGPGSGKGEQSRRACVKKRWCGGGVGFENIPQSLWLGGWAKQARGVLRGSLKTGPRLFHTNLNTQTFRRLNECMRINRTVPVLPWGPGSLLPGPASPTK